MTGPDAVSKDEAIRDVERQMTVLAGLMKDSIRHAALEIDPALRPFGLKILRVLARLGPTQASVAADQLMVDRSVISREARQLEALGLIAVQADPEDGRVRFLCLTPKAVTKLAETQAGNRLPLIERLSHWPIKDVHMFATLLERLSKTPDSPAEVSDSLTAAAPASGPDSP